MEPTNSIDNLRSQLVTVNNNEGEKNSPRENLLKYTAYLPLFIICLCLFIGAGWLYLRYKTPVYNSSIKILVKDDSKKSGDDLSTEILSQLVLNGKSNLANEVEIVKSRTILEKVVRNLGINVLYYSEGRVRETEIYDTSKFKTIIFTHVKDSSKIYEAIIKAAGNNLFYITSAGEQQIKNNSTVRTADFDFYVHVTNFDNLNPEYKYKAIWYSPAKMAEMLTDQIDVEPLNKDASIIDLSYQNTLPVKARDILNSIAEQYTDANIQEKNGMIDNTIHFVDERLLLISGQLGGVENELKNFKETNNVIDSGQQQLILQRTKNVMDDMDQLQIKLNVTDMVSQYVNDPSRKFTLVPSTLGIEDPTLLDLIKTYNDKVMQREELLKTLPEGNIAVSSVEDELTQLQPKIVENVNNIRQSYNSAYALAKNKYDQIMQAMGTIPAKQKELLEIERQQGIKEKLYLYLLQKREESAINRASAIGNSSPIDPAITGKFPLQPQPLLIYLAAVLLGLSLPFLYIYLKGIFNDRIITRADIFKFTKTPVAGEINHTGLKDHKFIEFKSRSILAEQFRIIRTNLQYFPLDKKSSTIMVTSTMANEGKTFVSMNFGAILSLAAKKVVLVEFDLRKPKISKALNIDANQVGITSYLAGNTAAAQNIIPIEGFDNYFLLPSGPIAPNPAELLMNNKLDDLFIYLKENFDYIIIDCPPIGMVSDPKVISKYSDLNFYIVRQRFTFKKQLKFANELYEKQLLKNMVLIINDVVATGANGYYGYGNSYGYGYSYGYNYNYGYDEKRKKIFGIF